MNYKETYNITKQYLLARIPFISLKTVEKNRALTLIGEVSKEIKLPILVHSMSKGFYNLETKEVVSDEKTVMGALDYISETLKMKQNQTFVFTDIVDIDSDTLVSRYFMDIITLAEEKGSSILVITSDVVWAQLQRLGMNINFSLPTEEEILKIVNENIEYYRNQIKIDWDSNDAKDAATVLSGISEVEIKNVLASLVAKGEITKQDLIDLKFAKDKLFSNINGLEKINVDSGKTFAGLKGLHSWLLEKKELLNPLKKEEMKKRNIKPPRGILLVGVPGCGKSLSAKVIASTWKLPLYRLDFATVQGKYVGQSEQQLKEALETAEHVSPCVLWIDEIEKGLAATSNNSDVTTKLVGQFLFWLQECEKEVFVIATANDVSMLPAELLRKGRFDEMFFVDLPSNPERAEIIKMYIDKYLKINTPDNLLNELVRITDGFSGADIEAAIRDISYKVLANDNLTITGQFLIDTLNKVVPITKTSPESIEYIRRWGQGRCVKANVE